MRLTIRPRQTRTQQANEVGHEPLKAYDTIWMEGVEQALVEFRQIHPFADVGGVHAVFIDLDSYEWRVTLRCGQTGYSNARILLDFGYHLEWVD